MIAKKSSSIIGSGAARSERRSGQGVGRRRTRVRDFKHGSSRIARHERATCREAGLRVAREPGDHHRSGPGQRLRHAPRRRLAPPGRRVWRGRRAPACRWGPGSHGRDRLDDLPRPGLRRRAGRALRPRSRTSGRTSLEARIEIYAEPMDRRRAAAGGASATASTSRSTTRAGPGRSPRCSRRPRPTAAATRPHAPARPSASHAGTRRGRIRRGR